MQHFSRQYFEKSGFEPCHIFFSALILVSLLVPSIAKGEGCDFSHLAKDIPLISERTIDVTEKVQADAGSWQLMKKALPNVQRIYFSKEPRLIALPGWAQFPDNIAKFTRKQTKAYFVSLAEVGKSNAEKQGQEYDYWFADDNPLTMYVKLSYAEAGVQRRDIAMDIVATSNCIVSIKVSGKTDELGSEYWQKISDQFKLTRDAIAKKHGIVQFSSSGSRIWWKALWNNILWFFAIALSGYILSFVYLIKFSLIPSPTTKKYAVFIMILAVCVLTITVLTKELLNIQDFPYEETIPYFSLIFLVHLWAFVSHKPRIVAFSLWLIIVGIIAQIGFGFAGRVALKTTHWVGVIFGLALVIYILVKSSILKGPQDGGI
jgi:hypothetical protein